MFVIIARENRWRHHVYDVQTGADVILGLTGDDREYERSLNIMGNMRIGDIFDSPDTYMILCVEEDESDQYPKYYPPVSSCAYDEHENDMSYIGDSEEGEG